MWPRIDRQIPYKVYWDFNKKQENFKPGTVKPLRPKNSFSPQQMKELENRGQLNLLNNLEE